MGVRSDGGLTRGDVAVGAVVGGVAGVGYGWLAVRLAGSDFGLADNFAFDLDTKLYLCTYALSPLSPGGVKHPLILMLRPLVQAVMLAGATPEVAAGLVMAGFAGLAVGLWYMFLRTVAVAPAIALPFAVLFAVGATQLVFAMIPETYGPAAAGLTGLWLLAALRLVRPEAGGRWRYVLGVMAFGITLTNIVQAFIVELMVWGRHFGWWAALRRTMVFGLWLALVLAVLVGAVWHALVLEALRDPVLWVKKVYWLQTFSEKAGIGAILLNFIEFVVVAPEYVWIPLEEGWRMRDFRVAAFSPVGMVAAAGWSLLLIGGVVSGLRDGAMRWLTVGLLAAFVFNVVLHTRFQFRLSLFIYTPHVQMIVFALAAGLARVASRRRSARVAMSVAMVALAAVVAVNNVPMAVAFAGDFRDTGIKPPFTCADYAAGRNMAPQ